MSEIPKALSETHSLGFLRKIGGLIVGWTTGTTRNAVATTLAGTPISIVEVERLFPVDAETELANMEPAAKQAMDDALDTNIALQELDTRDTPSGFSIGPITFQVLYGRANRNSDILEIKLKTPQDPRVKMEMEYDTQTRNMDIKKVYMKSLKTNKFYASLARPLLRHCDTITMQVVNEDASEMPGYGWRTKDAADCVLKSSLSLIAGVGNNFICHLDAAAEDLIGIRVDERLEILLELAKYWARDPTSVDGHAMYTLYEDYKSSSDYSALPEKVRELFTLQLDEIKTQLKIQ